MPDLGAVGELLLQHEPRRAGPGLEQPHDGLGPRRVQVHDGVAALLRGQQFGAELVARADRRDPRVRRRGVDPHRARQQHAAALVLERDAVAVAPVGRPRAVVGAPVPLQAHQGALGHVAPAEQLAHLVAVGVEDRDRDGVGLLDAEGQARHVEAPVAVGREDAAYADLPQHGRRVLQALGDEEGREGGEHEDGEDARRQSAQSVTSEALAISRAAGVLVAEGDDQREADDAAMADHERRAAPRAARAGRPARPGRASDCSANDSPPGIAKRRVRAFVAGEALGILGADLGERAVRPVARVGLDEARVLGGPQADPCGHHVRRLARAQQRAAPQRDDLDPGGHLGQRDGLLATGRVERHGRMALEAALVVVGRLPVAGQVDGHAGGGTTAPCRPRRRRRPGRGRPSARALASIGLTWAVGTPRILATSSAAARALAS